MNEFRDLHLYIQHMQKQEYTKICGLNQVNWNDMFHFQSPAFIEFTTMMTSSNGTFSALLALREGIAPVTVGFSPHKGQWRRALMFSLICTWTNGWENNQDAGNVRRHRAHYDVTIMTLAQQVHPTNYAHGSRFVVFIVNRCTCMMAWLVGKRAVSGNGKYFLEVICRYHGSSGMFNPITTTQHRLQTYLLAIS